MNKAELDGAAFAGASVGCLERRRHSEGAAAPGWLPQAKGHRRPLISGAAKRRRQRSRRRQAAGHRQPPMAQLSQTCHTHWSQSRTRSQILRTQSHDSVQLLLRHVRAGAVLLTTGLCVTWPP